VEQAQTILSHRLKGLRQHLAGRTGAFWLDGVLLILLLTLAYFYLRITPEFAANLPQDAVDFVLPALNLVKRGSLVTTCYGRDMPPIHPLGLPLLLAPSYLVFGNFPGNGIYSILFCALGTVTTIYIIGRRLCGRMCGCFAALFLMTHNGFHGYSQKIMSEVPSAFLLTLIFLWLLHLSGSSRPTWGYYGVGALVGLAIAVRWDNVLILVPALALLVQDSWRSSLKRGIYVGVGLLPWVLALGLYNYVHHGNPLRTGYGYWRDLGQDTRPVFSFRYATARGYWGSRGYSDEWINQQNGNLLLLSKTFANQVEMTRTFDQPKSWQSLAGGYTYRALVTARTLLGFVSLVWCIRWWRKRSPTGLATLWFTSLSFAMMCFYTCYCWQEERFLLRLVPFFCLFNAMVPAIVLAPIQKWASGYRITATLFLFALLGGLICSLTHFSETYFSASQRDISSDDNVDLLRAMRSADNAMESNAWVVTDFDPFRSGIYLIEGTERTLIQLSQQSWTPPGATEHPEQLVDLLRRGRPGYLFLKEPFELKPSPTTELAILSKLLFLKPLMTLVDDNNRPIGIYLYRFHLRDALPFFVN
jgi:4-amino-4-deoxy-L-arabinose transferase-like glycosyltransferase